MSHWLRMSALFAIFLASSFASALPVTIGGPTTGLWWNPQESGRGFNIDIQDNIMVVTTYIYTPTGEPIWYLSSGIYDANTGIFHSSYDSYSDGQCFGCSPRQNTLHSGAGGAMTITFHNDQAATLTWQGGSTEIAKANYGFNGATSVLYGEWALSFDIAGLIGGDWVVFNAPYTASDGTVYASGYMDGASQYLALGIYDTTARYFYIIVSVGSFNDFYELGMDDHRAFGTAWVEPENAVISGSGSPAAGGRLLFKTELGSGTGAAGVQKSQVLIDRSNLVSQEAGSAKSSAVAAASKLQRAMEDFNASHH